MGVYAYEHVCVLCACGQVCMFVHASMYVLCLCVQVRGEVIHVGMCTCVCVRVCVCVCVYICAYEHVCVLYGCLQVCLGFILVCVVKCVRLFMRACVCYLWVQVC